MQDTIYARRFSANEKKIDKLIEKREEYSHTQQTEVQYTKHINSEQKHI